MSWLSEKMKKWENSLNKRGKDGSYLVSGWEKLDNNLENIAIWSKEAMEKLNELVDDKKTREEIMIERCCVFTEEFGAEDILKLAELYKSTGSCEQVVKAMRENKERFGQPYIEGSAIIEIRNPRDIEAYKNAKSDYERQLAACYCPLIRATKEKISLEYCYCSAGWYKGIYEGIFGKPVNVKVDESIINGDSRCKFTITIPEIL